MKKPKYIDFETLREVLMGYLTKRDASEIHESIKHILANQERKEPVFMSERTGSRTQDALRAGYVTTCAEGIAKLLNVHDATVEACKDFEPRALKEAKERLEEIKKTRRSEKWSWADAPSRGRGFLNRWLDKLIPLPQPKMPELYLGETTLNIPEGRYETVVYMKSTNPEKRDSVAETIYTRGKRGEVVYDAYDLHVKTYIPDHCIKEIKEAQDIGVNNIQIAYPVIKDGVIPGKDPIIVGYIEKQMFLICRYNPGDKEFPTLEMKCTMQEACK